MEINFRFILIILSVIVIGGIYLHGRINIRKGSKNPYKLKAAPSPIDEQEPEAELELPRAYDSEGFDQDGVGRVKPIHLDDIELQNEPPNHINNPPGIIEDELSVQAATMEDFEKFEQHFTPVDSDTTDEPSLFEQIDAKDTAVHNHEKVNATANQAKVIDQLEPMTAIDDQDDTTVVYAEPSRVKPVVEKTKVQSKKVVNKTVSTTPKATPVDDAFNFSEPVREQVKTTGPVTETKKSKAELKRDQMEMDFDQATSGKKVKIEQEVLALSVVVSDNQMITGAALLPTLLTLGLKFGEMNIFHRHQDNAGNGKITFSVANMMNPGTFDLDNMETFVTKGITLFMTLPNAGEPAKVFKQMLSAAKQIAVEVEGQVLDGQRSMMTKQTEQHYMSKIREFDRRARLAGA